MNQGIPAENRGKDIVPVENDDGKKELQEFVKHYSNKISGLKRVIRTSANSQIIGQLAPDYKNCSGPQMEKVLGKKTVEALWKCSITLEEYPESVKKLIQIQNQKKLNKNFLEKIATRTTFGIREALELIEEYEQSTEKPAEFLVRVERMVTFRSRGISETDEDDFKKMYPKLDYNKFLVSFKASKKPISFDQVLINKKKFDDGNGIMELGRKKRQEKKKEVNK
ncbi:unnamed protein product [Caenorhabditis angaria]|uniref:Uncharacterized protein n=1 Tax=Caenorhabditis angaria TaxID=860376 RepID=A0A9P1IGI6_9PELO|nr:unnamed protein product [Caenorhabditis angaria]